MNQAAMARTFNVSPDVASAAAVGSNLVAVMFLVAIGMIPNIKFFREKFKHPYMDELVEGKTIETAIQIQTNQYSVAGLVKVLTFAFTVVGISNLFCNFMDTLRLPTVLSMLATNSFLISSLITLATVTFFPKFADSLCFGEEIGSFMLLMFMTVMGTGASIMEVLKFAPIIVIAEIIVTLAIMVVTLTITKLFKMNLEEALIAINASYGGPATAAAYVGSKGWQRLMVPAILIGVYGYIVGNVLGIVAGNLFL